MDHFNCQAYLNSKSVKQPLIHHKYPLLLNSHLNFL